MKKWNNVIKKGIAIWCVCMITLLFSSCALHLGDVTLQLPWWMITVLSIIPSCLVVLVVAYVTTKENAKSVYVCSRCGHRFVPGWRLLWSTHSGDDYVLRCPRCSKRNICSMSHNQEL